MTDKNDTDYTNTDKESTEFDKVLKPDTDMTNNPDYTTTLYNTELTYDSVVVYNGVGRGVSYLTPKVDTTYATNAKPKTGYAKP